jgi:hypothetical protein
MTSLIFQSAEMKGDNTLYRFKGRLVRYRASGHAILCTCNGSASCAGNVRLHECERRQESAHMEPVASRSKNYYDYKMMHSGSVECLSNQVLVLQ